MKQCDRVGITNYAEWINADYNWLIAHDLKRTFLTIGEAAMIPFSLLKALANHKTDNDVTGGYINPEANTLKQATWKIADYIQQHTTQDNQIIITLKSATH